MGRILGVAATIVSGVSAALMAVVCLLGPSAAVPVVSHGPPGGRPGDLTVTVLGWAAILSGGLAVGLGLMALARGWRPRPWLLFAGGAVAAVVLAAAPVAGSTDVLDYAVYGRITALGNSPWLMTPAQLLHTGDPVGLLSPTSWRHVPAVYGPVAIGVFWFASVIGGTSMAVTVSVIKAVAALSFLATGCLLDRTAGPDAVRRARVHMLWTANPLMLWSVVAGAHVDVIGAALTMAAIVCLRHRGVLAGAAAGALMAAAIAVKAPFALVAAGALWSMRRSAKSAAAGAATGGCLLVLAYWAAGGAAIRAVADKHGSASVVDPWKPLRPVFHGVTTEYEVVAAAAALVIAVLAWWSLGRRTDFVSSTTPSVVPAFALTLGWVLTAAIQHPWYDAMLFPLLALLPRSRLDLLLVTRFTVASLAYVPGVPGGLRPEWLQRFVHSYDSWLTSRLLDVVIAAVVLALVWWRLPERPRPGSPAERERSAASLPAG
jgi:hypothetical protein